MTASARDRLKHILEASADIRNLLAGKLIESLRADAAIRAALERFIEIISEGSRHVPAELKAKYPDIPWLDVANIGNRRRHGYDLVDERVLWDIYAYDLDAIEAAAAAMIGEVGE